MTNTTVTIKLTSNINNVASWKRSICATRGISDDTSCYLQQSNIYIASFCGRCLKVKCISVQITPNPCFWFGNLTCKTIHIVNLVVFPKERQWMDISYSSGTPNVNLVSQNNILKLIGIWLSLRTNKKQWWSIYRNYIILIVWETLYTWTTRSSICSLRLTNDALSLSS